VRLRSYPTYLMQIMLPKGKVDARILTPCLKLYYYQYKRMEIIFNNQKQEIAEETLMQHALDLWLGDKQQGIAVAVNDTIVHKTQWGTYVLQPDDDILVIRATQGG